LLQRAVPRAAVLLRLRVRVVLLVLVVLRRVRLAVLRHTLVLQAQRAVLALPLSPLLLQPRALPQALPRTRLLLRLPLLAFRTNAAQRRG
jgi:hypothetical protein